jgi:hypothetical protein
MLNKDKHEEYEIMQSSPKRRIDVQIPNGPLLKIENAWSYFAGLHDTTLKTTTPITIENPLLVVEEIDLSPVTSKKFYKVTVKRQPDSNLLYGPKHNKNLL